MTLTSKCAPELAAQDKVSSTKGISVQMASTYKGKQTYFKAARCNFCEKVSTSTNIAKHMLGVHKKEPEVAEILSKQKRSKERFLLIEKQRNMGNYKHNCEVIKSQKGKIIPWRAPSEHVSADSYGPCEFCLGFFLKKELWRHQNKCKFKVTTSKGRKVIARSNMLLPAQVECSLGLRDNIFGTMTGDDLPLVARNDELIVMYSEKLYEMHSHLKHRRNFIRQKIRRLARFLLAARDADSSITNLRSCILPCKFPVLISTIRKMCGYSSAVNSFQNPSLAKNMGPALKTCASVLRSVALIKGDTVLRQQTEDFIDLCESQWRSISSAATSTLERKNWNKPHILPLTEDIRRVTQSLKEEREKCMEHLRDHVTTSGWHELAKASLANVILFNRRRSGEAARMLVSHYEQAATNTVPQDDVLEALSDIEIKLASNFRRVEMPGKRGRKVPVLLTRTMCKEIDVLLATRDEIGVCASNAYVFARPFFASEDHIAGHTALSEAAKKSGAKEPSHITSTKLRKHLATVCQILNLSEHELEQVCGHMGHDIAVHREFYRLPEDTYQLAKVSRLLLCMEQGKASKFKGKSLDEIEVGQEFNESEVEDELDEEHGSDDEGGDQPGDEHGNQPDDEGGDQPVDEGDEVTVSCLPSVPSQENSEFRKTSSKSSVLPRSAVSRTEIGGQKRDVLSEYQHGLVRKHFKKQIDQRTVPNKNECMKFIESHSSLKDKTWRKIKFTVRNEIEKHKRRIKKLQKV